MVTRVRMRTVTNLLLLNLAAARRVPSVLPPPLVSK